MNIKTVTVIGVTGTMGANVAGIFASFGNAKVFCLARDIQKVKATIPRIVRSVRADAISKNLVAADFSRLDECVAQSDLVFESVSENLQIKSRVARLVGQSLGETAVACTGTSGLSIDAIAECYPENCRDRVFGTHMFNPPYSMSLCELIPASGCGRQLTDELADYLRSVLRRTVVEVRDSPAFLGNRIGFQFINEALQYAERYSDNGGIDYIDAILGPFTGRAMAPLATSDFVGLDVHKAIVDNVRVNTDDYARETFALPGFVQGLIDNGQLGRKAGKGLYQLVRYENGLRRQTVYDIVSGQYRDVIPYAFPFVLNMRRHIAEGDYDLALASLVRNHSSEADICLGFLLRYIAYSIHTSLEVGYATDAADDVMAMGFNWCPPLSLYNALAAVGDVPALMRERIPDIYEKIDVDVITHAAETAKYDYRPFFRSGR